MSKIKLNVLTGKRETSPNEDSALYVVELSETELAAMASLEENAPGSAYLGSIEDATANLEAVKTLVSLINSKDYAGLRSLVEARANAKVYQDALKERDNLQDKLDAFMVEDAEIKKKKKRVSAFVVKQAMLEERALTLEFRKVYEELVALKTKITEYRIVTSQAAQASAYFREAHERAEGVFLEYTSETMGDLIPVGTYEAGTPEWHAARQGGLGGSDIGSILKVDGGWGSSRYNEVLESKLGLRPIDPELPDFRNDLRTPIGRGNAWEEYIRQTIADKNPDLKVAFCKTSWEDKTKPYRKANFDGLILNDSETVEEVVEIKTGSSPKLWGPESAGFASVPKGYRKQILWYALNSKARGGRIIVVLDDYDYREYTFSVDDPEIAAELLEMVEATDAFWAIVVERKEKLARGEELEPLVKKRARGVNSTANLKRYSTVYASYTESTPDAAYNDLVDRLNAAEEEKQAELTEKELQKLVVKAFADFDPSTRSKPLIGIDLETTGVSAKTARIIETGIVELAVGSDTPEIIYGELHGVSKDVLASAGIGPTDIHGITPEMLEGKLEFSAPEVQETILRELKRGTLVAHNAGFEDRFLSANLAGYVEARAAGEINILDTRDLASVLIENADDSTLESFAEYNGIAYEGAHSATQDTVMMMKALARLQRVLHSTGHFRSKRATEKQRVVAQNSIAERILTS